MSHVTNPDDENTPSLRITTARKYGGALTCSPAVWQDDMPYPSLTITGGTVELHPDDAAALIDWLRHAALPTPTPTSIADRLRALADDIETEGQ